MSQRRHVTHSVELRLRVQPESRLRVSREADAATAALVEAARLAEDQKRALHTTVHESSQSTAAIAEKAGISYSFVCNAANPSLREQLPFARLPLLLKACDDLTLVRFLAQLQGADVIRLPKSTAGDVRQASATMREFVEFMEVGAATLEDQQVAPREFADIEREGMEAVRAILALIEHYRARVERPLLEDLR